jgi:hypothetical protein
VTSFDLGVSAVLVVATAANMVLLFAVVRRLRLLEAGLVEPALPALPAPGTRIPGFPVAAAGEDLADGDLADDADLAGGPHLIAFVMPGCDPCHAVLTSLRADKRFDPARTMIFVAGEPGDPQTRQVLDLADGLGRTVILEQDGPVTAAFGSIDAFPTLLSVRDWRVVSSGRSLRDVAPASELAPAG